MVLKKKDARKFASLIGRIDNDISMFNGYVNDVPVNEITQVLAEIEDELTDMLIDAKFLKGE